MPQLCIQSAIDTAVDSNLCIRGAIDTAVVHTSVFKVQLIQL